LRGWWLWELWVCLEVGLKSVLLDLGLVHLEVVPVLLMLMLAVLLLRSVLRLSMIAFRGGPLGVRLALGCGVRRYFMRFSGPFFRTLQWGGEVLRRVVVSLRDLA
jgi:hypothetical protein